MIASRKIIKEIEQAKMSHTESVSVGLTHALEILGESTCVHPVCPLLKRVGTSQSFQKSQGFRCPQYSESIEEGMPPPPQHENVERPQGEPPQSWSSPPMMRATSDLDSAEQYPPAREVLPAQAGESRVKEKWSSKKRSMASQSSKTRASAKSTQSTTSEHVKRTPKRSKILWKEPILVDVIANPIRGDFQGINRVESILRTSNAKWHEITPETQESDPNPGRYQSVHPLAQTGQIRSDKDSNSTYTDRQPNHVTNSSQRAFPVELIEFINEIREEALPVPTPQEFVFDMTEEAAKKNFMILKKYDFDLEEAINAQKSSPLGYGSEFRPPQKLRRIFKHHPLWERMECLLIERSKWPLTEINKSNRIADLTNALQFGNHKGASQKPDLLKKLISNDICYGYGLVIPWGKISRLPNACVAPMNITKQFTLNAGGEIVDKERLTHDQNFRW